jgi:hypothetical protein
MCFVHKLGLEVGDEAVSQYHPSFRQYYFKTRNIYGVSGRLWNIIYSQAHLKRIVHAFRPKYPSFSLSSEE